MHELVSVLGVMRTKMTIPRAGISPEYDIKLLQFSFDSHIIFDYYLHMTNTTLPRKNRMKVFNQGKVKEINCFPHERDFMAGLAKNLRRWHRQYGETRPTLVYLRIRAAQRYL